MILTLLNHLTPSPELVFSDTFDDPNRFFSLVPPQHEQKCLATAQRLQHCQATSNHTVVLACHRRWCNTFGHCATSPGLGDRFHNHALVHVQEHSLNNCKRVLLDHPLTHVAVLKSMLYQDPYGWIAEMFRFRSYPDLSERHFIQKQGISYSHFMSDEPKMDYDACLFHAIFRPNAQMQRELEYHNDRILQKRDKLETTEPITIGIHFRTGDGSSFERVLPEDVRIRGDLKENWHKMRQCAQELGQQLAADRSLSNVKIRYYLATDNAKVKELVRREKNDDVYVTDLVPTHFRGGPNDDRNAWLELFLLSQRQGLVMNVRTNQNYKSTAASLSTFAVFARKIGFFADNQVKECVLDEDIKNITMT